MWFLLLVVGCSPSCEQTCSALLACEAEGVLTAPNMNLDECESACSSQENVYNSWDDESKQAAFDELKSCIVESECSDLNDGVCYNEDVYVW